MVPVVGGMVPVVGGMVPVVGGMVPVVGSMVPVVVVVMGPHCEGGGGGGNGAASRERWRRWRWGRVAREVPVVVVVVVAESPPARVCAREVVEMEAVGTVVGPVVVVVGPRHLWLAFARGRWWRCRWWGQW
jgi:hypothetical protein